MNGIKKVIVSSLFLTFLAVGALAQNSSWVANYSHSEEDLDMDWSRTSYWFQLFVKESKGKLTGIYTEGINGEARHRFRVTIKTRGDRARIFYDRCLPTDERVATDCYDSDFKRGDLLFEFERFTEKGKPQVYTLWRKMNLGMKTESGASGKKVVFFRRY